MIHKGNNCSNKKEKVKKFSVVYQKFCIDVLFPYAVTYPYPLTSFHPCSELAIYGWDSSVGVPVLSVVGIEPSLYAAATPKNKTKIAKNTHIKLVILLNAFISHSSEFSLIVVL
jgi:hypothetical protein